MIEGIGRIGQANSRFCVVSLCRGKIEGKDFYAFVAIEPKNYPYFKKYYRHSQAANFDAYGQELLRGWGFKPPQDIVDHISRKYKIKFESERELTARFIALTSKPNKSPFPLKPATTSEVT